jgi:hypothetical protein
MSLVNISPNMLLPVPVPTQDFGPDWANQVYSCLYSQIDAHDHSSGKGVQITPAGININENLSFSGNSTTNLLASSYNAQSLPLSGTTYPGAVYVAGVDLYYNDINGNQIKLTSGGLVNATSSGISSGTASATFISGVLVVNANTNTPANIQGGSVFLGNNVANSKYLELSPPNAMAANYQLVLPSLPTSTSFMQLDTAGNMSASVPIANGITRSNQAAVGQQVSSSCGTFTSSLSSVNITNLTVTITTSGRPVMVILQSSGAGTPSYYGVVGSTAEGFITVTRDLSTPFQYRFQNPIGQSDVLFTGSVVLGLDVVSAGTHTYTLSTGTNGTVTFNNLVLMAYEL